MKEAGFLKKRRKTNYFRQICNFSKSNFNLDFKAVGFRDVSYSRDLDASLSICKLITLIYLGNNRSNYS